MGIMVLGLLIGILVLLVLHLRKKKKVRHIHSSSFDSPAVSLTALLIDGDVFLEAFPVLARLPVCPPNDGDYDVFRYLRAICDDSQQNVAQKVIKC